MAQGRFRDLWTRSRGPAASGRELVVMTPPMAPNAAAFERCRALIDGEGRGRPVRLIAEGATVERYWPAWVAGARTLHLTELDAYLPDEKGAALAEVTAQLEGWLDRVFEGVAPGVRASTLFWGTAFDRLLDKSCQAWLLAAGIDEAHPRDQLLCTDEQWECWRFLQARRGVAPGALPGRRARQAATFFALEAASIGKRLYEFVRERPVRRALAERRAALDGPAPRVWITLLGHWPRASRPVVDTIAPLARASGEKLGVLLQAQLAPGLRTSNNEPVQAGKLLPTLDAPELEGLVAALDQGVSAESLPALGRAIADSVGLSLRALGRVLRAPLALRVGGVEVPLALADQPLAKLLTLDVLRARESWLASQALAARRAFADATVILPHAGYVGDCPLIQTLEQRGATTVELVHGVTELGYQLASGRSHTAVKALWSQPEARALAPFLPGQRCQGGYFPRPAPRPVRRATPPAGAPLPVLVASNYLVNTWGFDPRMFEHYMEPLLAAAVEAQRRLPWPIELRWRPHPDDDPRRVELLRAAYPQLGPSTGTLDDDFRWARVLVTSMSSITIEALWYELPIFVHEIPWWNRSMMEAFDPARRFGGGRALGELLEPCVERLLRGDAAALAPEASFRRALFGAAERPLSAGSLLGLGAAAPVRLAALERERA